MWHWFFLAGALAHHLWSRCVGRAGRRETPLHVACRKGNAKTVKYLLDRGASPNVLNLFRESPLLLACTADNAAIVKMLLDAGGDPGGDGAVYDDGAVRGPEDAVAAPSSAP